MYRSDSGAFYVIATNNEDGRLRQWRLIDRNGRIGLELAREIAVGSQAEGCVADDELGHLYVAEEDVGLWKYSAEPDGGAARTRIDHVGGGHLVPDIEGVSIYYGADGTGFLVASNQGDNDYVVYRREAPNEYLGKFGIIADRTRGIDGVSDTDGLEVVSVALNSQFPGGLLVVQDGSNDLPAANQNFKYVSWRDVVTALGR
jgi:3-phytase